jgi:hypothetical protein
MVVVLLLNANEQPETNWDQQLTIACAQMREKMMPKQYTCSI